VSGAAWPREVVERDHEIQNPTSAEKIRLFGEYMRLTGESRVLDIACGKAGPATILAEAYGCRILGVELRQAFVDAARTRIAERGLDALIEVRAGDGAELELDPESWDAALCIGAAFAWGTIADAAAALAPAVRRGGFVAIGEPFWRQWPLPFGVDAEGFVDLDATVERFESRVSRPRPSLRPPRTTGTGTRACTGVPSRSGSPTTPTIPMWRTSAASTPATAATTFASSARCSAGPSSSAAGEPCAPSGPRGVVPPVVQLHSQVSPATMGRQ
jgi:hypothetical protein